MHAKKQEFMIYRMRKIYQLKYLILKLSDQDVKIIFYTLFQMFQKKRQKTLDLNQISSTTTQCLIKNTLGKINEKIVAPEDKISESKDIIIKIYIQN